MLILFSSYRGCLCSYYFRVTGGAYAHIIFELPGVPMLILFSSYRGCLCSYYPVLPYSLISYTIGSDIKSPYRNSG